MPQICQIARMLKFIYPTQRSCEGHNVSDQSESRRECFCERFSSKTIERNFLKHGSFSRHTWSQWSLDGHLSKLCPTGPGPIQDL
jgi:hypothetical protein